MNIVLYTAPVLEPITLNEAKSQCKVEQTDHYEDDRLNGIITTARLDVENDSRRQILTATWDYYLDEFPSKNYIKLPFGNLQTVTHVKYTDSDGDETEMTVTTEYLVETNGDQCGRIVLPYGVSWPSFTAYPSHPIVIRYVCGWTTRALVPATIKSAIRMRCAKLYKSMGDDFVGQTVIEDKTYARLVNNIPRLYDEFD